MARRARYQPKQHTAACCVPKAAKHDRYPCGVCGCAEQAVRHRVLSNRHYHEYERLNVRDSLGAIELVGSSS